jgi:hypothetical protein
MGTLENMDLEKGDGSFQCKFSFYCCCVLKGRFSYMYYTILASLIISFGLRIFIAILVGREAEIKKTSLVATGSTYV